MRKEWMLVMFFLFCMISCSPSKIYKKCDELKRKGIDCIYDEELYFKDRKKSICTYFLVSPKDIISNHFPRLLEKEEQILLGFYFIWNSHKAERLIHFDVELFKGDLTYEELLDIESLVFKEVKINTFFNGIPRKRRKNIRGEKLALSLTCSIKIEKGMIYLGW